MHRLVVIILALVASCVAVTESPAAIRRAPKPARPAAIFPRVVRDEFVQRLAAKVVPAIEVEPLPDYRPGCCFDASPDGTCYADDGLGTCWHDAGDGCGPRAFEEEAAAYAPDSVAVATASGPRWGEVSREEQRRSIREILHVLAERQPAKAVGMVAYAVGYVESGFNPTAEHPKTKACGLYQFLRGTWRDFASPDVADDPDACRNPRENAAAAVRFLTHLYERNLATIVEQTPTWETMTEWERLTEVFIALYSMHNYGPNDPRWQLPENGTRQLALAHLGILKDFYEGVQGELQRLASRGRPAKKRGRR